MTDNLDDLDRYLIITADSHAGPEPRMYEPYIEKKYLDDFQGWVKEMDEMKVMIRQVMGPRSIGVDGDPDIDGPRGFDSARRLEETEADGVTAEVIFTNSPAPFAPSMFSEFGEPEVGDDHEKCWAGLKAHNRWLADFCKEAPGRRAGICQIFLPYIEESIEEIRWAKEAGLTGGVLLPGAPPGSGMKPLYAPDYEPIWQVCEELGMPLNHHSGGATPDFGMFFPQSLAMFMLEVTWWTQRALWHLIFSGALERHPNLQLVFTETGVGWVPRVLGELDSFYRRMKYEKETSEHVFGGPTVANLSLMPSEYFARQCHIGASFLPPNDCDRRNEVGIEKIMWGTDYPHTEGCYPYTRELLRLTFSDLPTDEIQKLLGLNAARVYGFDLDRLRPIAERVGPTKAEIAQPLSYEDIPERARKCPAFSDECRRPAA